VDFLAVALITNGRKMSEGEDGSDFMSNCCVAIYAFDLVAGDMILMHKLRSIFSSQYFGFFMTLETLSLRDMAVPSYHIDMTFFTSHPSRNIFPMIEAPAFDFNVPFGFDVARGTSSHSTRETFLLPSWSSPIKVTNEAVGFVNGEVSSLDELSMASCAPKVHPPSQLPQMFSMGKVYILKYYIPFQIISLVTPLLQTVSIINFIMNFFEALPNHEISKCQLEIHPFSLQMIQQTWTSVTTEAGDFVMGGCFPRVDIFLHVVTEATKRRAF
jgi:hypothetical protein